MSDSQTELERLQQSGNEHHGRKDYPIAVECYRAALEHGMNAHSPLFNFGYSLAQTGNHTEAAQVYQKAIAAGSGAMAHNNLGVAYRDLEMLDEAHSEYLKAIKLDRTNPLYWRNLAVCLDKKGDSEGQQNALENAVKCGGCTARDWNLLGCAKDRKKENEEALNAFRKAAYVDADACYFNNMALMHSRLGHTLDAYHACRHALNLNATYESALKEFPRFKAALKLLPQSRQLHAPHEIGPHDYVNPYVLLDLTETDEQPEAYEWFDQPKEWEGLLGSLTRRRRTLKAELELNDGALGWLPKLRITDEVVHRVLADLDDDGWHANHWAVFRMPMLKQFIMYGELDYFYSREHPPYPLFAEIAGADTADWEHEDFIEFISPFFSRRLAVAVKQSLDTANYEEVTALFATRLPITATDFDEALEPARRHFARRREILGAVETKLETTSVKNTEAELKPAADEAKFLNILPAQHGEKLREDLSRAYRNISIALANHREDYLTSELALKAAEHFKVSETTKERLAGDRTTVEGLIKREKEQIQQEKEHKLAREKTEKQYTLRLTLKRWFKERILEITPERFCWSEESISAQKIAGIRFGIDAGGSNSILAVHDTDGKTITVDWLRNDKFATAVSSVMALYSTQIMKTLLNTIHSGGSVTIGLVELTKTGITVTKSVKNKWGNPITSSCRWNQAFAEAVPGSTIIYSNTLSSDIYSEAFSPGKVDITRMISCRDCWNACLLPYLFKIMKSSTR